MSAHLATPPSYVPYPGAARYGDYYWFSAGSMDSVPAEEAPAPDAPPLPAAKTPIFPALFCSPRFSLLSPASSSSGTLTQYYTPDSATSPTAAGSPSPHSSLQKVKAQGKGVVKAGKSRTAFSQDQLKALHQRFQSQKYLSPQQIRELAAALELTYKQVKTWFQNQRMKFKRCQKESQWVEKGMYLPQNGVHQAAYLDIAPTFHQVFPVGTSRNLQAVPNVHQAYSSGQTYGNGQNLYSLVSVEDEGPFGKGGTGCNTQQTMGLLSQQMNFYHSCFDNIDYVSVEVEDAFNFQNTSDTVTPFSSSPIQNQCQVPWHPMGTQSWYESQV
ncbi:homeobox protein NANOG-like isoform X2 [Corvus hawaiiensis]|uniref:homeobox protein NANOG-like isoform X2 n=1 Tax=Corvus hawaiiensis TaxID=134902 RepID=UPI00201A0F3C|nr:homeobox protein NANOG-like isoform X2 [Corvus hawaiiensis]